MFKWLGGLGDSNEKELKHFNPVVDRINQFEPDFEKLDDDALRAKTGEFRARFETGETLDDLLPEAFAAVREAAKRTIGQRHYDEQLIGGMVLHQGKIAEMKTGEGKTLVATLPLYLNSLSGRGCHLVTVNDYLARRDPYWMGPIYHALGVRVSSIYPQQNREEQAPSRIYDPEYDSGDKRWRHFRPVSRSEAYQADITYGTSSDFGFDHLRDNMVMERSQCVQRPLSYAIVDEIDNLLIDEARTPLIISGAAGDPGQSYQVFARLVPRLRPDEDYVVEEKERSVNLTDVGISNIERMLNRDGLLKSPNLYDQENYGLTRYLESALKAHSLFRKNKDYVVEKGEVIIVDEFTGRLMFGRRYSEGLHQAIEAKEHVKVQRESMTYATTTIQNYFRMYQKLSGMTGTALTEAEEFHKIYRLEVVVIPTHEPMVRQDYPDQIYKDENAKFRAVVREIEQLHAENRPVLIGTISIEKSEQLNDLMKKKGISCRVLNANPERSTEEADIIARAGEPGAVTVATNMAGRGVDIVLGGSADSPGDTGWQPRHETVVSAGGLHIIGTEHHEARRIDNQLRGRAGRQGDPGSSRFFVSLEDDIMKRFGGDRIKSFMNWVGLDEDTPIENKLINKTISDVQKRVEGYHFDMRKHLVEYDDVVNKQRELIYGERNKILDGADLRENILAMVNDEIKHVVATHLTDEHGIGWDTDALIADTTTIFPLPPDFTAESVSGMKPKEVADRLVEIAGTLYQAREETAGAGIVRVLERLVMLRTIDSLWVENLTLMENMRLEAAWQTLRQTKAVDAYKRGGYQQFQVLLDTIRRDVAHAIFHVNFVRQEAAEPAPSPMALASGRTGGSSRPKPEKIGGRKVGRNEPCPCGSGKKYKHCHGG